MMKILYIEPIKAEISDEARRILNEVKRDETEIHMICLERGPRTLEYRYYESLVLVDLLRMIKKAEGEGFDAAVIGCFYDVGLEEAREITKRMVVTAPCESAVHLAATLGDKFSIIVGRRKWIPQMRSNVERYGLGSRLASFKAIDIGVHGFRQDETDTFGRFLQAAREAIESDGAEVIVLGCTDMYGFHEKLGRELGVPVIDAMIAAFKTAEFKADLKNRVGWTHSKIGGYESPPPEEIAAWGLAEQYDFDDMRSWLQRVKKP